MLNYQLNLCMHNKKRSTWIQSKQYFAFYCFPQGPTICHCKNIFHKSQLFKLTNINYHVRTVLYGSLSKWLFFIPIVMFLHFHWQVLNNLQIVFTSCHWCIWILTVPVNIFFSQKRKGSGISIDSKRLQKWFTDLNQYLPKNDVMP